MGMPKRPVFQMVLDSVKLTVNTNSVLLLLCVGCSEVDSQFRVNGEVTHIADHVIKQAPCIPSICPLSMTYFSLSFS